LAETEPPEPPGPAAAAPAGQKAADELLHRGQEQAAHRQWSKAAESYKQALEAKPTDDGHFWFEYAALLVLSGDRAGYRQACAHMVERCGKVQGLRAYHVARACTLAPDSVKDLAEPRKLAETELHNNDDKFWSLTEQAALEYRSGKFKGAVPLLQQSTEADQEPGKVVLNWLWLAMARQQQGQVKEARESLDKAARWLDEHGDGWSQDLEGSEGLHLHNWLEAYVLRREAEALLGRPKHRP
jgi:tetratricopeptide (TPR) repeat protein